MRRCCCAIAIGALYDSLSTKHTILTDTNWRRLGESALQLRCESLGLKRLRCINMKQLWSLLLVERFKFSNLRIDEGRCGIRDVRRSVAHSLKQNLKQKALNNKSLTKEVNLSRTYVSGGGDVDQDDWGFHLRALTNYRCAYSSQVILRIENNCPSGSDGS